MPQPDLHAHYQLRLVQRFDGQRIVTHRPLAQAKSFKARDKTLDFTAGSERGALQKAKDYCRRGAKRKGELPGYTFIGVVLVKHTTDSNKPVSVLPSGFEVTKRPRRTTGTTVWLYFVDASGRAYKVDPSTHQVLNLVV